MAKKKKEDSFSKYKAFPFKSAKDRPTMPRWLQADPETKKLLDKIRKQKLKKDSLISNVVTETPVKKKVKKKR